MTEKEAKELTASIWCEEKNRTKEMDVDLAEAFADMMISVVATAKVEAIQAIFKNDPTYLRSLTINLGRYFVNNKIVADRKAAKLLADDVVFYIFGVRYDDSTRTVINIRIPEQTPNADT